ncbi:class I SAM-dependent methyltransferase [Sphingomonas sp.]|uniref:class I SAM-dependent methyltransferase n=1 Tax=Sphingomonas sp. TaxID=28214 RepID=UPI0035AEFC6F
MASTFISRGAQGYDRYMGRWSARLAPLFLDFAGLAAGDRVLDVGCGTGNLALAVAARPDILSVDAIDYEEQFVLALRRRNTDQRVTVHRGDACALPFTDASFDRALSMLVLHFVSDAPRAVAEMRRVLRPGGVAAATVWDTYGGMPSQRIFWDTVAALEPSALGRRVASLIRPATRPGELLALFGQAGFAQITEAMLTIRMDFESFDDYWHPLIGGQGTLAAFLSELPAEIRGRIEQGVRAAYLCGQPEGPRSFASVAWAIRGVVPLK